MPAPSKRNGNPTDAVKIGVYIPRWLYEAMRKEVFNDNSSLTAIVADAVSARYPAEKKRYERLQPVS
ncbi:MAG: hypothetical protein P4L84_34910 [Isosphaeraceae bacterium]|nr:hypothetical protein [Isosphaeraceae bacterium]